MTFKSYLPLVIVGIIASLIGGVLGFGGSLFFGSQTAESLRQVAWLPDSIKGALPKSGAPVIEREIVCESSTPGPAPSGSSTVATPPADEQTQTKEVVEKSSPSVVSIAISRDVTTRRSPLGNDFFRIEIPGFEIVPPESSERNGSPTERQVIGGGTGFLISRDGLILTNRHVVIEPTDIYTVVLNDGRKFDAKVLARDTVDDLALIKIEGKNLPPPLPLGDSDKLFIGQTVIAIGNALSEYHNTVTKGVVSGIGRRIQAGDARGESEVIENAIQTDTAINPGNSGGPLLNLQGEVIGINTAINAQGQLVGFAIPINLAKRVINSYQKYGRIVRPMLGIRYAVITPEFAEKNKLPYDYGVLIQRGRGQNDIAIVPNSPAEKAGLKEGDIILEIDSKKITPEFSVAQEIARHNVGDTLTLKVTSEDKMVRTVRVTLTERGEQ